MSVHITSCALCGDTKLTWYLKNSSFSDVPFATLPSVTGRCATKMSAYYCLYFLEVSLVDLKQICKTYSSSRKVVLAESPSPQKKWQHCILPKKPVSLKKTELPTGRSHKHDKLTEPATTATTKSCEIAPRPHFFRIKKMCMLMCRYG